MSPNPSSITMQDDWGTDCPNDTDGDGNCGKVQCPHCGPHRHELARASERLNQGALRGLAEVIIARGNSRQRALALQIKHECMARLREDTPDAKPVTRKPPSRQELKNMGATLCRFD